MLQARFAIVRRPACFFHLEKLKDIMMACMILHNMYVEDERHTYLGANDFDYDQIDDSGSEPVSHNPTCNLMQFIERHNSIRDRVIHSQLQADLVEHLWQLQARFSDPDRSLNRKSERFKVFKVEPRSNRGRTVMTS